MFTGIITDIGTVAKVDPRGDTRIRLRSAYAADSIDLGASIACDGVCLTVVDKGSEGDGSWFDTDASAETLAKTTLGTWAEGTRVNLERALKVGDELGGHIVSGHVDGTATVTAIRDEGDSTRMTFEVPSEFSKFIAEKGSVALNGTSLTVNEVDGNTFGVNLIPHTKDHTTWGTIRQGDRINLEIDTLAPLCGASGSGGTNFMSDEHYKDAISTIDEIIDDARNGRMFILVDHEDRENEGDLVIPAQMATPDAINFMATHGRGLICLTLTSERLDALGLPLMAASNSSRHETAFTISIEAREGVTTGISAHDRARTVSVAIDPTKGAPDIATPGHIFPLRARDGGVLVRAGHTEAAVDISRLAGLKPLGRDLRDHERRRLHGPPARPRRLRAETQHQDRDDFRPDRLSPPL